ncbi:MAG: pilus assembly protein PilC [Candidatus Competibacteraceae bacterium]|nr:pilus assembly protein PilC [Candidatus Competibacteraceae bacterium]
MDVVEYAAYKNNNQYYLATKYGGFKVPTDPLGNVTYNYGDALTEAWWHTNTLTFGSNKKPDSYYVASRADQMVAGLTTAFDNIAADLDSSASSVAANSTRVGTDTAVFQAVFDSGDWSGELRAYTIDTNGVIATSPVWNAAEKLDALSEPAIATRKIFTVKPAGSLTADKVNFVWSEIDTTQQDKLRKVIIGAPVDATTGENRLKFLRGSRVLERTTTPVLNQTNPFRERGSRLGDIVNSDPQFIHKQDYGYAQWSSSYSTFRTSTAYQNRLPMVVVGANDGMLHGFRADVDAVNGPTYGGTELFAYVPNGVYDHLFELTLVPPTPYEHNYYVDGTARVADAWLGTEWKTIVVGTTGAGGKSVFALDITDPANMTKAKVLWEFSPPEMGYTLYQPAIVPLSSSEFGVVVTSGYEAPGTDGKIWILNPADGSIRQTITVNNSGSLGSPLLADLNNDRIADRIYVGDTNGNLWRFDNTGSGDFDAPSSLKASGQPIPLFIAQIETPPALPIRQAITAAPVSAFNIKGEHMVFFGTGSFYRVGDNDILANPPINTFYGIIDRGSPIVGRSALLEQEILDQQAAYGKNVRAVTENMMDPSKDGWYLDLVWKGTYGGPGPVGERVVSRAIVRDDRVIFSTLIPSADPCAAGGTSFIMELGMYYGGRLDYSVFDINKDKVLNDQDKITVTINGVPTLVPVSGIDPGVGIIKTPAAIELPSPGDVGEVKVVSGSKSGQLSTVGEASSVNLGRQSWEQLR